MGYLDEQGLAKTVLMIKEWVRSKISPDTVITRTVYNIADSQLNIAAGTPGTRCANRSKYVDPEKGDVIACYISRINGSSDVYNPMCFMHNGYLYINLYRASSSAFTVGPEEVAATVVQVKKQ